MKCRCPDYRWPPGSVLLGDTRCGRWRWQLDRRPVGEPRDRSERLPPMASTVLRSVESSKLLRRSRRETPSWVMSSREPAALDHRAAEDPQARRGDLQLAIFDTQDLAEISAPELYPDERLIVCRNPLWPPRKRGAAGGHGGQARPGRPGHEAREPPPAGHEGHLAGDELRRAVFDPTPPLGVEPRDHVVDVAIIIFRLQGGLRAGPGGGRSTRQVCGSASGWDLQRWPPGRSRVRPVLRSALTHPPGNFGLASGENVSAETHEPSR